jgi:nucleoside-diphosphate-sugar epimerase
MSRTRVEVPGAARLVVDDVQRDGAIDAAVVGQDAVVSALGIRRAKASNPRSDLVSPPDFTSRTATLLVDAMKHHGVRRVIAVSAAGVGDSRKGLNWMIRFFIRWSNVGANYRDLEGLERAYAASGLDWCCVRPTGLKDGPVSKRVRQIDSFPFNEWISRADVADWMVEHLAADVSSNRTPIITEGRA